MILKRASSLTEHAQNLSVLCDFGDWVCPVAAGQNNRQGCGQHAGIHGAQESLYCPWSDLSTQRAGESIDKNPIANPELMCYHAQRSGHDYDWEKRRRSPDFLHIKYLPEVCVAHSSWYSAEWGQQRRTVDKRPPGGGKMGKTNKTKLSGGVCSFKFCTFE